MWASAVLSKHEEKKEGNSDFTHNRISFKRGYEIFFENRKKGLVCGATVRWISSVARVYKFSNSHKSVRSFVFGRRRAKQPDTTDHPCFLFPFHIPLSHRRHIIFITRLDGSVSPFGTNLIPIKAGSKLANPRIHQFLSTMRPPPFWHRSVYWNSIEL